MSAPRTVARVRLAELIAMISLGTDLGMGQPMEHVLRQSLIALRLAERLGLDEESRGVVYYVSLLSWVGCHVDAYEQAKWFGDDLALKADTRRVDLSSLPGKALVLSRVGSGRGLVERARLGVKYVGDGLRPKEAIENHWRATNELAAALGLGRDVRDGLYQTFERWDGRGVPAEARGEEILLPARVVNLADVVAVHRAGGSTTTQEPDHSASLGDSITSSTRIRFSVHTEISALPRWSYRSPQHFILERKIDGVWDGTEIS